MDTPESAVFRHAANRKWFALVTTVPLLAKVVSIQNLSLIHISLAISSASARGMGFLAMHCSSLKMVPPFSQINTQQSATGAKLSLIHISYWACHITYIASKGSGFLKAMSWAIFRNAETYDSFPTRYIQLATFCILLLLSLIHI